MKKEIAEIYLKRMNNAAHFLFVKKIRDRAKADPVVSVKCKKWLDPLDAAVEQEDANLVISQKSQFTDGIVEADGVRGMNYTVYKQAVKGLKGLPAGPMAEAAKILWQHIKDYGIDTRMQLDRETSLLLNFVNDLETKYAEEVALLGLTTFVTNLKTANEKVIELTDFRTEERMAHTLGALKTSRDDSDDKTLALFKTVNAYAWLEDTNDYDDFIDYVNTEITHYKREVLGQTGGTPDDKPAEGGEDETPDETPEEGGTPDEGTTPDGGETPEGGSTPEGGGNEGGETPTPPPGDDDDEEVVG